MALPSIINSGLSWSDHKNHRHGPFEVGSNLYVVLLDKTNSHVEVWKSTDGGDTWAEQDAANHPGFVATLTGMKVADAVLSGTTIHVAYVPSGVQVVAVRPFNTATDTWGTATATGPTLSTAYHITSTGTFFLSVRSNGDYVLLHASATESIMGTQYRRVAYSRHVGSTWTNNVAVSPTGTQAHYDARAAVLGSSDRTHVFYTNSTSNTPLAKTLTSANALSVEEAVATTTTQTANYPFGSPTAYVDGANTRLVVPINSVVNAFVVLRAISDDTIGATDTVQTVSASTANPVETVNANAGAVAVDGTTVHAFWPNDADQDLYRDSDSGTGTWGTDVEFTDAVTINGINATKITNAIGILYDDNGTVKFDKFSLATSASRVIASNTAAVSTTEQRALTTTAAIQAVEQRTVSATAVIQATNANTIAITASITISSSRVVGTTSAVSTTEARVVVTSSAIQTVEQRAIPVTASIQTTQARSIGTTSAVLETFVRIVPTTATIRALATRDIVATAAIQTIEARAIPTTAVILSSLVVPASASVLTTQSQTITATASISTVEQRSITLTASITQQQQRSLTVSAALQATQSRTKTVTASISVISVRSINASASITTVGTQSVAATASIRAIEQRSIVATTAILVAEIVRSVATTGSVLTAQSRSVSTSATVRTTETLLVAATASIIEARIVSVTASVYVPQVARPISDVSTGLWTTDVGATTNLYDAIDESVPNHTDYIQSSESPSTADIVEVKLDPLTDPVIDNGHKVWYVLDKNVQGDVLHVTVRLVQGTTVISTDPNAPRVAPNDPTTYSWTLNASETDAITDYTDLRLRFEATKA